MKNLGDMMKQVQAHAERACRTCRRSSKQATVTGQSGGGLVKVTLNGKGAHDRRRDRSVLLKPEEKQIVEDLIVAAHDDAKAKVEAHDGRGDESR